MLSVWTILLFVFILGLMILVHELGHFLAAKAVGIKVEEFSIGMGPKLWSKTSKETQFSIRALPIGGFVRMLGEEDMDIKVKGSFGSKTPWQRFFVVAAGVVMNFILVAIIGYIIGAILGFGYRFPIIGESKPLIGNSEEKPLIVEVSDDSPAALAGVNVNDILLSVDDQEFGSTEAYIEYIGNKKGLEVKLTLGELVSGAEREVVLLPRVEPPEGEGPLGVALSGIWIVKYEGAMKAGSGFFHAINTFVYNVAGFGELIKVSVEEHSIAPLSENVSSPVGVFYYISEAIKIGSPLAILDIISIVGISLVFVNLLPIPSLDGGYLLFLIIEGVSGKRLPGKILQLITQIGMVLLILLLIVLVFKDLIQFQVLCRLFKLYCN